jgi:hypothetical protein
MNSLLNRLSESNEVLAVIVAALLSFLSWLFVSVFSRGKVAWGFSHQHTFFLQNNQPPILVYIKEIWVQNIGRAPVENVEVVLAAPPNHFDIWPQRNYTNTTNPGGNFVIKIDGLNRNEYFAISMLQVGAETPLVTNVRWSGGVGQKLPMAPQRAFPRWVVHALRGLLLFALFSIVYFLSRGVLHLLGWS